MMHRSLNYLKVPRVFGISISTCGPQVDYGPFAVVASKAQVEIHRQLFFDS